MSMFGVLFVFLSSGLLGMWISLEIGFFGFLPILNGKSVAENEATVKYFIVQSVGSALMLVSFLFILSENVLRLGSLDELYLVDFMMLVSFMVKLGVFPLHFWFPSVMSTSSWFSCFWLSVVQKVGPFWAVSGLGFGGLFFLFFSIFLVWTSIVGAFGGIAQVQFRPLLAYSSLGQTGWMGLICMMNLNLFVIYMFLYSWLLGGLLCSLHIINSYSVVDVPGWCSSKGLFFWVFSGGFFISLSGLPPLAGSALKLAGVLTLIYDFPIFLSVLIFSSMVSLYYYLNMFINSVVCLGSGSYSIYDNMVMNTGMVVVMIGVLVLNWLGGFPLFLGCVGFFL
uniref:NADH-ubiquinone oxidoreductase chain 2 n=1 Tax=Iridona iridescens TaxID=465791 RepID=I6NHS6_IRIIR|nr:NADH dehydrogenase subunit 2 [Iridona iridescens]AEV94278.1 NADH dehydrogenase subunit 2 [Iridona iridescens]